MKLSIKEIYGMVEREIRTRKENKTIQIIKTMTDDELLNYRSKI